MLRSDVHTVGRGPRTEALRGVPEFSALPGIETADPAMAFGRPLRNRQIEAKVHKVCTQSVEL
eukprot:SAG11_NODE_1910_length_4079_cov_3.969095_3_plen_63_part_00